MPKRLDCQLRMASCWNGGNLGGSLDVGLKSAAFSVKLISREAAKQIIAIEYFFIVVYYLPCILKELELPDRRPVRRVQDVQAYESRRYRGKALRPLRTKSRSGPKSLPLGTVEP